MKKSAVINGKEMFFSRREFINNVLKGTGALAIGTFTVSFLSSCSDDPTSPDNEGNEDAVLEVDLSLPQNQALATIGGTLALDGNDLDSIGILLYRETQSGVVAVSRRCTHESCKIGPFQGGVSTCSCHGSQFSTSGDVLNGPAATPLKQYNTVLDGDLLTITA